jgi:hypothetical protein
VTEKEQLYTITIVGNKDFSYYHCSDVISGQENGIPFVTFKDMLRRGIKVKVVGIPFVIEEE